jgi:hypothetical protein
MLLSGWECGPEFKLQYQKKKEKEKEKRGPLFSTSQVLGYISLF